MAESQPLDMIKKALSEVSPGSEDKITPETHLVDDEILDSLDLMNFLFELEQLHGSKLKQIDENFDDYRVSTLIGFLSEE